MFKKKEKEVFILSKDSTFEGDIQTAGNAVIEGTLTGSIKTDDNIIIKNEANVKADVLGTNVSIDGNIEGAVDAQEIVQLGDQGRVQGSISCKSFKASEGSVFKGKLNIKEE
jgi:cytoskeletal protein CcmA (bactofilin family)